VIIPVTYQFVALRKVSALSKTKYFTVEKKMKERMPVKRGEVNQEMKIFPPHGHQSTDLKPLAAIENPMSAAMIVCVVEIGYSYFVARRSPKEATMRAQRKPNMRISGEST
jgi:hypothetical protein